MVQFVYEFAETAAALAVFGAISEQGLTLSKFLDVAFRSQDSKIKEYVSMFYKDGGHAALVDQWAISNKKGYSEPFTKAAARIVIDQVQNELWILRTSGRFQCPANDVSADLIYSFSTSDLNERFEQSAPILFQLLAGFTKRRGNGLSTALISTIASMLLIHQSQNSNLFQVIMGLYLYSQGCPKRVVETLSEAKLCVSYTSIHTALSALTKDALEKIEAAVETHPWYLVYDNINIPNRKYDQRIDNRDTFENGTTATIVIGVDLGNAGPFQDPLPPIRIGDFMLNSTDDKHLRTITQFYLVDVLQRHFGSFKCCSNDIPQLRPLEIKKTVTYPLPAMKIDQSSVEGNLEIIETIIKNTLRLPRSWFDNGKKVIVAGDQLTVARVATLKRLRESDVSPYERMEWAIPVLQLFHLQMLFCSTILRTHYGIVKTPGSLASIIDLLGRKRVGPDTPNYHAADELLRNTFDAMVLQLWDVQMRRDPQWVGSKLETYGDIHKQEIHLFLTHAGANIRGTYFINSAKLSDNFGNVNVNSALFLRDMVIYKELSSAIKMGDVGRIEEVLKIITIMFQAGGTKNYANQLLQIAHGIRNGWNKEFTEAVFRSWLINSKGKKDGWVPADLHQEHNNLLTKTVHRAKGSNMSWDTLANSISTNIHLFSDIASKIEGEFETSHNSNYHTTVSAWGDILKIRNYLERHDILSSNTHPELGYDDEHRNVPPVNDLIDKGFQNLASGRLETFIKNRAQWTDENNAEGLRIEDEEAENEMAVCVQKE